MDFDLVLVGDALLNEKLSEILSEVPLQLDNQALFLIFHDSAVAMVHFLKSAKEFFVVQIVGETLHNGQAFTSSTLLIVQIYR